MHKKEMAASLFNVGEVFLGKKKFILNINIFG